ncbi:phage portal protein [Clostridium sardiniense]|uniref:phage portal protein n=1 Tax=Clostridium sardiniense TaxID=29369 RepID=UPI001959757A|nr:phage portal protein [Clostridium sardiniense]MBM7836432.1 SPP1 family phage portal protein [Clostridium sardiniense]
MDENLLKDVKDLYQKYLANKDDYQKMWDYYVGSTDIETTYPKSKFGNNRKVKANFIKKFINEEVAFATGNSITYTRELTLDEIINGVQVPEDSVEVQLIDKIMKYNPNSDAELMTNQLIFGQAMEMYYIDDNMFKIRRLSPLNSYVKLDLNGNVESAIYVYQKIDDKNNTETFINYFTSDVVYTFNADFKKINEESHYLGIIPIGYCELIDGKNNTLFNDLKSIQDNLENILSDFANEIGDNRMSYLILKNLGLSEEQIEEIKTKNEGKEPTAQQIAETIIKYFRDNGIILMDADKEVDSDAKFLVKQISSDVYKTMLDITTDMIYQLSQHINLNQQQSSNTSGVALMTRIISLRNKIKIQQNCMSKAIRTRLYCIISWINSKFGQILDSNKVGIKYTLNVPSDDSAMADIITKLVPQGIISAETAIENLSFVTNAKAEHEKALKEIKDREGSMGDVPGDPGV